MWGAECQSLWKQLLILIVLCQPHEYTPQGQHSPGTRALEEADVSLPGGWHWAAYQKKCPFTCQSCAPLVGAGCQTSRKGVSAAMLCLACRCLGVSLTDGQCFFTSGVVNYFWVFLILVLWVTKLVITLTSWFSEVLMQRATTFICTWVLCGLNSWRFWLN